MPGPPLEVGVEGLVGGHVEDERRTLPPPTTARSASAESFSSGCRRTRPAKPGPFHHGGSARGASPEEATTRPPRSSVNETCGWTSRAAASRAGSARAASASAGGQARERRPRRRLQDVSGPLDLRPSPPARR